MKYGIWCVPLEPMKLRSDYWAPERAGWALDSNLSNESGILTFLSKSQAEDAAARDTRVAVRQAERSGSPHRGPWTYTVMPLPDNAHWEDTTPYGTK